MILQYKIMILIPMVWATVIWMFMQMPSVEWSLHGALCAFVQASAEYLLVLIHYIATAAIVVEVVFWVIIFPVVVVFVLTSVIHRRILLESQHRRTIVRDVRCSKRTRHSS